MLGAVVAPTDAVAAVATFASVRVPERVKLLVQGESLINDATGLTAFRVALGAAGDRGLPGGRRAGRVRARGGRRDARRRSPSSWVMLRLIRRQPDVTVSVLLTLAAAYASYIAAEEVARLGHPRRGRLPASTPAGTSPSSSTPTPA